MASPFTPIPEQDNSLISGVAAAILALASALDKKGALKLEDYRSELVRLSNEMPYEDAGSGSGFVIEQMIALLDSSVGK